jgi:protease II
LQKPDYIQYDDNLILSNFDISKNYLSLNYINDGNPLQKILHVTNKKEKTICLPEQLNLAPE